MALKKFEEYAKEFVGKKGDTSTLQNLNSVANKPKEDTTVVEKLKVKNLKNSPTPAPSTKKIQENAFLVGNDFKVKVVIDVPQALVQEYIDKVKKETDKDPLDNFSEAEIAEQIVTFLIKQNLVIDNLTPDFTVGSENVGSSEKNQETISQDAEDLSNDLDIDTNSDNDSEEADGEIEFKDFNDSETEKETMSEDEASDGEIEFSEETEKKDLGEKREVEDKESDPDSNFEEIEFSDENEKGEAKPKTIGDLKKNQGEKVNTQHKEEEKSIEEEEEIEDMYKKIGYKVGYFESLNMNSLRKY